MADEEIVIWKKKILKVINKKFRMYKKEKTEWW